MWPCYRHGRINNLSERGKKRRITLLVYVTNSTKLVLEKLKPVNFVNSCKIIFHLQMRCLDCQKMALLCTSTSKSIVEDPKGRYYLSIG